MRVLLRAWAILVVTVKRLVSERWLALATALGLIVAVALTTSIPMYSDAVHYRILLEELAGGKYAGRPPFAFMFRYVGAWAGRIDWEDVGPVDAYLSAQAGRDLGLPQTGLVRYFETDNFRFFPKGSASYTDDDTSLAWVTLAFVSDLEDHVVVQEGGFPSVSNPSQGDSVEVLVSDELAAELGLQIGEEFVAYARRTTDTGERVAQIPVRISGVWKATDPGEEFWFYDPRSLADMLLVPEETYANIVVSIGDEVNLALWYLLMDGSGVYIDDVSPLVGRINYVEQRAAGLLHKTSLDVSPEPALRVYQRATGTLIFLLYAFSVPIVGLLLVFIGMVVGLAVGRQRNEIAVLRSRGATSIQVIGIAVLEGLLLGLGALVIGLLAGELVAQLIGRSRSFLDFSLQSDLRVGLTTLPVRFGMAAIALALIAQVAPTIGAARHTIVTYKQVQARTLRRPWWQRAWLDVLLLIPTVYGFYILEQQQGVVAAGGGESVVVDPFQNPLLLLVPALAVFALSLFILRILPTLMSIVAWIGAHTKSVGLLLAARHLSRTPGFYAAPLVLLILTLSLSAFTASLAQTLDGHLHDRMYYRVGADMGLGEFGESTESFSLPFGEVSSSDESNEEEEEGPRWLFLPVSAHLGVSEVEAAARVGRYRAVAQMGGGAQGGTFIGVDWWDFARVAYWRDDFASTNLIALMNALAVEPQGVLVSRDFRLANTLSMGDTFPIRVHGYGEVCEYEVKVVGDFELFPTWYGQEEEEEAGLLFVGNLEHLFEQMGMQLPTDVWLKVGPGSDYELIADDVRRLGVNVLDWASSPAEIAEEQRRPERQGLFGVLSVGFMAAASLTVIGFLLYAFFSFRRRFVELGVLRAIGLSAGQMTVFLAWELVFLIVVGLVAGTGLGVGISHLFIPYLQSGSGPSAELPPFVVQIAWPAIFRIYVLFGLLFAVALGGLVMLLMRIKIFQAIKLGETV